MRRILFRMYLHQLLAVFLARMHFSYRYCNKGRQLSQETILYRLPTHADYVCSCVEIKLARFLGPEKTDGIDFKPLFRFPFDRFIFWSDLVSLSDSHTKDKFEMGSAQFETKI